MVRVIAVIEKFQGKVELEECLFRHDLCPDLKTWVLRLKLRELEQGLLAQLKDLTLEDLLVLSNSPAAGPQKARETKKENRED